MAETSTTGAGITAVTPPPEQQTLPKSGIEELATIAGDVQRTVLQSTRSLQQSSSTQLRSLQDFIPQLKSQYQTYEDALLKKVKDELTSAREHPAAATAIAVMASFLLLRGPRRFIFRQTLGQFQSEEARFVKAEKKVKGLGLSIDLLKKESGKLVERAALAEREMKNGHTALMVVESDVHHLAKSVYKAEVEATNLMDFLREIPRREALKLRAEVASVASLLSQQRIAMDTQMMKISDHRVST